MKNDIRAIFLAGAAMSLVGCAATQPSGDSFNARQLRTANYLHNGGENSVNKK